MHSSNVDVYLNFINGQWRQGNAPEWDENRNPARPNDILGRSTRSIPSDITKAVDSAVLAQIQWAKRPRPARMAVLEKAAGLIRNRAEQFAKLITLEQGKNLNESRAEVLRSYSILEFVASESRRAVGKNLPSEVSRSMIATNRAPVGVVGVITTWTCPLSLPVSKIAPALLEGNAVVFKPSTLTPAVAKMLVFTLEEAGIPAGVISLVYGPGHTIGQAIVADPRIKAIAFAGSRETAKQINMTAAKRLARTQIECGGKNSLIVCADADLDQAAQGALIGAFSCAGQKGNATSRIFVERSVHGVFLQKLVAGARQLKINDGTLDPTAMCPMIDEKRYKMVLKAIEVAQSEGAKLICGGEPATAPGGGRYITPTVFDEVTSKMSFIHEDVLGPVLAVTAVENFEQALELSAERGSETVSGSTYTSVYTNELKRVIRGSEQLPNHMLLVNAPTDAVEAQAPAGGIQSSIDFFSEVRTVYFR